MQHKNKINLTASNERTEAVILETLKKFNLKTLEREMLEDGQVRHWFYATELQERRIIFHLTIKSIQA